MDRLPLRVFRPNNAADLRLLSNRSIVPAKLQQPDYMAIVKNVQAAVVELLVNLNLGGQINVFCRKACHLLYFFEWTSQNLNSDRLEVYQTNSEANS